MAMTYQEAEAFALTLPGVTLESSYGQPVPKARGCVLIGRSREPGSYAVRATLDEIELLKETDPDCFWQSPHYQGWPMILVRPERADPGRIRRLIERAWWDRASRAQRVERGGERP